MVVQVTIGLIGTGGIVEITGAETESPEEAETESPKEDTG